MLKLSEWLTRVGFPHGNPFALKEADREGDLLQSYFVEHPAYNQLFDSDHPTSSVLAAPRGAGKSAIRRMFETKYINPAFEQRVLLVRMIDWLPLVAEIDQPGFASARYHLDEIMRLVVSALAAAPTTAWLQRPQSPDLLGYLHWLCANYGTYLTPSEYARLEQRGWLGALPPPGDPRYAMGAMPGLMRLRIVAQILQAIGFRAAYILIDRIDELFATTADWHTGARLLAPLICNLQLNEIAGLGCKYFIPAEIVQILLSDYGLRIDRIPCATLSWSTSQLFNILGNRLSTFSDGFISSLAALALPDLPNIDGQIIAAAAGSPRNLLNLGDWLFQACAAGATDLELRIQPAHIAAAQAQLAHWLHHIHSHTPAEPPAAPEAETIAATRAQPDDTTEPVPRLRVQDGVVWRGDQILPGWQDLPQLQQRLLQYLYDQRGKVCQKEAIIAHVWAGKPNPSVGDDSLRKLAERLIEFIEPDPAQPVYIQKVRGGHYRLDNTVSV